MENQELVSNNKYDHHNEPMRDRRIDNNHSLNMLLIRISADVTCLTNDVKDLRQLFTQHTQDETTVVAEAITALVLKSFPVGDPDGHKKYHEVQMKTADDKAAFWAKMRFELMQIGLIGFMLWLGIQGWKAFLAGPAP